MLTSRKLTYSKAFIDSEQRLAGSVSSSDFIVELNETLECFPNTVMYVIEESIPASIFTTQKGFFENFYLILYNSDDTVNRYITVNLADQVFFASRLSGSIVSGLNSQTNDIQADLFGQLYDSDSRTMRLFLNSTDYKFKVPTDADLVFGSIWQGTNLTEPLSINKLIGNYIQKEPNISWTSSFFNLIPFNAVYIVCNELSDFYYSSPNSYSSGIIKKVPITTNVGGVSFQTASVLPSDYIDVSNRSFKRLRFRITDATGKTIDLHNHPVSFSLLFANL